MCVRERERERMREGLGGELKIDTIRRNAGLVYYCSYCKWPFSSFMFLPLIFFVGSHFVPSFLTPLFPCLSIIQQVAHPGVKPCNPTMTTVR